MTDDNASSALVYNQHMDTPFDKTAFNIHDHHVFLAALGPVVYALRTKEGWIKIGHTANLATRRRHYSSKPKDLLAFERGTRDDEQAIHASLVPFRAKGREYYHPTPEVLVVVNDMREALGLSVIAA